MAVSAAVSVGDTFTLRSDYGLGPGMVPGGSVLTVRGVYPPGTPGIGYCDEDTVVADYPRPNAAPQSLAFPISKFKALTEKVK